MCTCGKLLGTCAWITIPRVIVVRRDVTSAAGCCEAFYRYRHDFAVHSYKREPGVRRWIRIVNKGATLCIALLCTVAWFENYVVHSIVCFPSISFLPSGPIKDALSVLLPKTGKSRAAKYKQISRTSYFTTSARAFEKRLKACKRILAADKGDGKKAWKH